MTVRIGLLGAARIAPEGLLEPARGLSGVEVVAVAARDAERAAAFAAEHGIASVEPSYEHVLAREDVDAVYIGLHASAHVEWSERALSAGKHVLCEKPLTARGEEARRLAALATERGLIMAEAFHYRYHPLMGRVREIVASGELGAIEFANATFVSHCPRDVPVYWDPRLGGGATMHNGCYPIHCLRSALGAEPTVVAARADWVGGVDAALTADLDFGDGTRGRVRSSIDSPYPATWMTLEGSFGELRVENYIFPYRQSEPGTTQRSNIEGGTIDVRTRTGTWREEFGGPTTYRWQLEAFARAVESGASMLTGGADMVGNAVAIEAMLAAAS